MAGPSAAPIGRAAEPWHRCTVHISQAGFTAIKGGRHLEHTRLDLSPSGPAGDRVFALVDLERGRVLRTVENPALLGGRTVEAVPEPSGRGLALDYWGRPAAVEIVDGPWAGRELRLGPARVRVLGGIDRCAVIDLDPATGASGTRLLQTLAGYRLHGRAIDFGMYAEVTVPGPVSRDDRVTVVSN